MPPRLPRLNLNRTNRRPTCLRGIGCKVLLLSLFVVAPFSAQDPTSYLTPEVLRVGGRLACRCGGCRNTVGNCPMLHCGFSDPMRRRLQQMKARGMSDDSVVNAIVREQGIVALASPPFEGFGLITWVVPPIALLLGFGFYSQYVRRHRQAPQPLSAADEAVIGRFRAEIERELDQDPVRSFDKRR